MARKKKKKDAIEENLQTLPQNILPMGERVYEDRNIYIHQKAYKAIHRFAAGKTTNESGGILAGRVVNDLGKDNTIIEEFIPAKHTEATPTTLTFTHETWEQLHSELEKKHEGLKIVGWIHTHPDFGIFLSENDRFIQKNFFDDPSQVAYVVDPVQEEEGFYFWIDGKLERCAGFYIFDKVGQRIKIEEFQKDEVDEDDGTGERKASGGIMNTILICLIALLILTNFFAMLKMTNRVALLEQELAVVRSDQDFLFQVLFGQPNVGYDESWDEPVDGSASLSDEAPQ